MTKNELLVKAKRDYPAGSIIKSAGTQNEYPVGNNIFVTTHGYVDNSHRGYLYKEGKWAEIVSYPKGYVKQEINKYYFY